MKITNLYKENKTFRRSLLGVIALAFLAGIFIGSILVYSFKIALNARATFELSVDAWQDLDFDEAKIAVNKTEKSIVKLQKITRLAKPLYRIPLVGKRLSASDEFLGASAKTVSSYGQVISTVEELSRHTEGYGNIQDKKRVILSAEELLSAIEVTFKNIQQVFTVAEKLGLDNINFIEKLSVEFNNFNEQDFEFLRLLQAMIGQEGERTYLLLMQNNTELRPTGGYIGNFGILQIKNGEVPQFYLKDSDYLNEKIDVINKFSDREVVAPRKLNQRAEQNYITPPAQIKKYFSKYEWRFGDANWSPSFPETARNAIKLYNIDIAQNDEFVEEIAFDGVIAFNPELVTDWLKIIGEVKIQATDKEEYTTENFQDTPQNLYPGDKINGKTITEKTYIVDAISQAVREKMFELPIYRVLSVINTLRHNTEDNNLFFYFNNPELQQKLTDNNWTGELENTDKDYLMVVDANLSRLRLDHLVQRQIVYNLDNSENKLKTTLELTYSYDQNREDESGLFNEDIGRYETYTRVYLPKDINLIKHNGINKVDEYQEFDKNVLGMHIYLNPGETKTFTLEYELPVNITAEDYQLFIQKQPGNEFTYFKVSLPLSAGNYSYQPINGTVINDQKQVRWNGRLDENLIFFLNK
ncbi:MAG: DUF4012 domain-containing protein [Candidatus Falkowbacteria bacterium]